MPLEKLKTDLSKKEYVSKVRFDAEFDIYRNLSKEFSQMIKYINIMIPEGLSSVPADDAKRKEQEDKVYSEAYNHTNASQETLYANIAFIPEKIYKDYNEIITLCQKQLFAYERRFNLSYLATQKETAIIEHITYHALDDHYGTEVFTEPTIKGKLNVNAMKAQKHLYDHIVYDSTNEHDFATELDTRKEVAVYVKLPNGFYISTPVGKYNPDCCTALYKWSIWHLTGI